MVEILLEEPIANLISQWPFVAVMAAILWFMRQDLKECLSENRRLVDKALKLAERPMRQSDTTGK